LMGHEVAGEFGGGGQGDGAEEVHGI
jgi:hypothetical protein